MQIFQRKEDKQVIALIDFGSGSVGASLAVISRNELPKILFTARERILYRSLVKDPPRLLNLLIATLEKALHRLQRDGLKHLIFLPLGDKRVKKAVVVLASPWYQAATLDISIENEQSFEVTLEAVRKAIAENEKRFVNALREDDRSTYFFDENVQILEHTIMENRINGYPVDNPFGRTAVDFAFSLYTSAASSLLLKEISDKASAFFHAPIEFHSFSLAAITSLRKLHPESRDYVCLDITGAGTEVMIVRKGVLVRNAYVHFGREAIMKLIHAALKDTPPSVALDTIAQYAQKPEGEIPPYAQKTLEIIQSRWRDAFNDALATIPEAAFLPNVFFIAADHDVAPLSEVILRDDPKLQSRMPGSKNPEVIILESADLMKLAQMGSEIIPDPFVLIESTFAHELLQESKV